MPAFVRAALPSRAPDDKTVGHIQTRKECLETEHYACSGILYSPDGCLVLGG